MPRPPHGTQLPKAPVSSGSVCPRTGLTRSRLQAQVQPITRKLQRIDLSIIPDFRCDEKIHGTAETFAIMVEDVDCEIILFSDSVVFRQRYAEDKHNVTITVPLFELVPPNYYISVIADRWLHAENRLPIFFKHLILPKKFPQPTALLELPARSPSIMSFASLPSIPSLYGTAEVCSTESEARKSVSDKASPKDGSMSDYIMAPVCESEPPLLLRFV